MERHETQRLVESVEILDGRRGSPAQAAVRLEDLRALMDLPPSLKATPAAGSTPTAAEFKALIDDVLALQIRLRAVVSALELRLNAR